MRTELEQNKRLAITAAMLWRVQEILEENELAEVRKIVSDIEGSVLEKALLDFQRGSRMEAGEIARVGRTYDYLHDNLLTLERSAEESIAKTSNNNVAMIEGFCARTLLGLLRRSRFLLRSELFPKAIDSDLKTYRELIGIAIDLLLKQDSSPTPRYGGSLQVEAAYRRYLKRRERLEKITLHGV